MQDREYLESKIGLRREIDQLVIGEARLNEVLQASSGHLLAALLQIDNSGIKEPLEAMGVTLGKVRDKLQLIYGKGRKGSSSSEPVYINPLTIQLIDEAERQA